MALWGQRFKRNDDDDDLPEEFKGKSPKEIAADLKAAKERAAAADAAETARAAAETEKTTATNELAAMRQRLAEVEADPRLRATPTGRTEPEPASYITEPERFVQEQTRGTTAVALAAGIMSAKLYATQQMSARDRKIFTKFEKDITKLVESYPATAQVNPMTWQNALIYHKGLHGEEIAKAESERTDFFAEPGNSGNGGTLEPEPVDKLTADEEEVCEKMHWDKAGYLKQKKNMSLMRSEKGEYARYSVPKTAA